MYKKNFFNLLNRLHVSEKTSLITEEKDTLVFRINKDFNKKEIKYAISKIFNVKINSIKTLLVKGKFKRYKKIRGYQKNWKKTYITFNKNDKIKILEKIN